MTKTEILKFENLTQENYIKIANVLKKGGIIIYPTETIYGIGANYENQSAIGKVYKIKKRKGSKSLICLFKNVEMVEKFANINSNAEKLLMETFWPGELTLILKEKFSNNEIACRVSPHPFIKELFKFIDFPIISTSANISGEKYTGKINDIIEIFKNKVDIIIDAGDLTEGIPSTIAKIQNNSIKILRQGKLKLGINEVSCNA